MLDATKEISRTFRWVTMSSRQKVAALVLGAIASAGLIGIWQLEDSKDVRVEVSLDTPCINPSISADDRAWVTGGEQPRSWDDLDSVEGTLQIEGDQATFVADDGWRLHYTSRNSGRHNCQLR